MKHAVHDSVRLELAQRIASGLPRHPEWIDFALANLDRWSRLNSNTPSLLRCYDECKEILRKSISEICTVLTAQTEEAAVFARIPLSLEYFRLGKFWKLSRAIVMQRQQLEHIIRAAVGITGAKEFVIIRERLKTTQNSPNQKELCLARLQKLST